MFFWVGRPPLLYVSPVDVQHHRKAVWYVMRFCFPFLDLFVEGDCLTPGKVRCQKFHAEGMHICRT